MSLSPCCRLNCCWKNKNGRTREQERDRREGGRKRKTEENSRRMKLQRGKKLCGLAQVYHVKPSRVLRRKKPRQRRDSAGERKTTRGESEEEGGQGEEENDRGLREKQRGGGLERVASCLAQIVCLFGTSCD